MHFVHSHPSCNLSDLLSSLGRATNIALLREQTRQRDIFSIQVSEQLHVHAMDALYHTLS